MIWDESSGWGKEERGRKSTESMRKGESRKIKKYILILVRWILSFCFLFRRTDRGVTLFPTLPSFPAFHRKEPKKDDKKKGFTIGVDNLLCTETLIGRPGSVGFNRKVDVPGRGVDRNLAILEEGDQRCAGGLVACQRCFFRLLRGCEGQDGEEEEEDCG